MKFSLSYWSKLVLLACFLTAFVSFSIRSAFEILLPKIMDSLALTKVNAGYISSSYFVAYTLFAPPVGILTDKIGGRKVITTFCIVLGVGTALMGTVTQLWNACILFFIVGAGGAACWAPVSALIQKWFSVRQRGKATGILTIGVYSGAAIMGLTLPELSLRYGWQFGWYLLGLSALILVPTDGLLLRSKPEDVGNEAQNRVSNPKLSMTQINYKEILRTNKFWLIGASYLALSFTTRTVHTFLTTYLTLELRLDYVVASTLFTVLPLCGILGALIFPPLSDRLGRRKTIVVSNLVLASGLLVFVLVRSDLLLLTSSLIAIGTSSGGNFAMYAACAADYFSSGVAGTVMGLWTTLYGLGSMISPLTTGYLADLYGTFFWSFSVASIVAVIAALLIFRVKGLTVR